MDPLEFTIGTLVLVTKVIVENKILDPLLLLFLGLLLRDHGNGETGVRWQVDFTSLVALAMQPGEDTIKAQLTCCLFPRLLSRENFIIPGVSGSP